MLFTSCSVKTARSFQALAVNSGCMMGAFQANDEGCVVAGTSEGTPTELFSVLDMVHIGACTGRIVELRESHIKNHTLVPERAMEQRNEVRRDAVTVSET